MDIKAVFGGNPEYVKVTIAPAVAGFGEIVIFGLNSDGIKIPIATPAPAKHMAAAAAPALFTMFVFSSLLFFVT
jgi:hypothetical protein